MKLYLFEWLRRDGKPYASRQFATAPDWLVRGGQRPMLLTRKQAERYVRDACDDGPTRIVEVEVPE